MFAETLRVKQQALSGEYQPHGELSNGHCAIGFAFGHRVVDGRIEPGLSNKDLSTFIKKSEIKLPLILQFQIADALDALGGVDVPVFRIEKHRKQGEYLDTVEVADQALAIMQAHRWTNDILITHPHHMPRVDAIFNKRGIEQSVSSIVPMGLRGIRFDILSAQERTRSREAWAYQEPITIYNNKARGAM